MAQLKKQKTSWMMENLRSLWERRNLIFVWTYYNLLSTYTNTKLGIVWIFLQPLVTAAIYSIAFGGLMGVRPPRDGVPFLCFYFSGVVVWQFFTRNVSKSCRVIVSNIGTMTQIRYPREISVITAFLEEFVTFAASFLVLVIILLIYGYYPTLSYLFILIIILIESILTLGIMFFVSSIGVFIRDIGQIIGPVLRLVFFMSGVIFSVDNIDSSLKNYLLLNPLVTIIDSFRKITLHNEVPDFTLLGIYFAVSVVILVTGYIYFKKKDATFVDHL